MKKAIFLFCIAAMGILVAFTPASKTLKIGERSDGLAIPVEDITGKEDLLRAYGDRNGLLVVFSCNTCPFVVAWEDRYNALHDVCKKNQIGMVLVNSNEAKRKGDDSAEAMRQHAKDKGYTMPYVIDHDHRVADAMGAKTTPHVFLFNNDLRLAYKGAIDDNHKSKDAVTATYLEDALNALGNAKEVQVKETKALGCSIKRVKK